MKPIVRELNDTLRQIRRDRFDYSFFFLQLLLVFGSIRQISTDIFLVVNLLMLFVMLMVNKKLRSISLLVTLSLLYFSIIILPIIKFGFDAKLYIGFYIRLVTAYFVALYFRDKFIVMYENLLFLLALISIPLFLIQIIDINFFRIFQPLTNALLPTNLLNDPSPVGFKYLVVFLVNPGGLLRNSGFAWEPAAFGASLTWAVLFNLFLRKFQFNNRLLILLFASLTTFSVGTYAYMVVFISLYLYERRLRKLFYAMISIIIIAIAMTRLPIVRNQLDSMYVKIQSEPQNIERSLAGESRPQSVSRVAGFYVNIKYFSKRPLGYGFADKSPELAMVASSPNGLMHILVRWGIIGITMFFFASYKLIFLLRSVCYRQLKGISFFLSVVLFIIPFTGNPFYNEPLLFAMLVLPFIVIYRKNPAQKVYVKVPETNVPAVRI